MFSLIRKTQFLLICRHSWFMADGKSVCHVFSTGTAISYGFSFLLFLFLSKIELY
jgi:hypothetical protein